MRNGVRGGTIGRTVGSWRAPRSLLTAVCAATIMLAAFPATSHCQSDSVAPPDTLEHPRPVALHATIRGWGESTWLLILDRSAADGGRLTNRGILQRFHEAIDAEYWLDQISTRYGPVDEYRWQRSPSGARFWTGSINHQDLIAGLVIKAPVDLGRGWTVALRFDKEDTPPIDRNFLRLEFAKAWRGGASAFFEGSLEAYKPEMDLTLGGGFADQAGEVSASVTWLDAFNDVIYQGLEVWPGFADTAIDYEKQAFALRATAERRFGPHLRLEADAAVMLPARVRAYRQLAADSGFVQAEEFAFVAGLAEWAFSPKLSAGGFANWVRAVTDRTPLPQGGPENDYHLVEQTTRAGAYALWQVLRDWRIEAWVVHEWRPERRELRGGVGEDVDYEDRAWRGSAGVVYRAPGGFRAEAAFEMDLRDVIRGEGQVPKGQSLDHHNTRLRLEIGWEFGARFRAEAGYRIDLDGDEYTHGDWYDGAHGGFILHW